MGGENGMEEFVVSAGRVWKSSGLLIRVDQLTGFVHYIRHPTQCYGHGHTDVL